MNRERVLAQLRNRSSALTLAALTVGASATVLLTDRGLWPKCPVFALTGIYCPGCGLLRGLEDLLHGNLAGAIGQNALIPLLPVFVALGFTAQKINRRWATAMVIGVAALVTISFTLLRNVPGSALAPN